MSRCLPSRCLCLWLSLLVLKAMSPALAGAEKSLAEAAQIIAPQLKAGCIVTGEVIDGKVAYGIAGTAPENAGAKPEQVLFEIGSISKTFTGLLLAQAVVEGKVKLETTVGELLGPGYTFADPRVAAITLKQLSTHTSGLPRLPGNAAAGMAENDPYANYDERLMVEFLTSTTLKRKAPFKGSYSNLGAGLLGHLLAKVYETSWEAAIQEKICDPLGLKHTRMETAALKLPLAQPHAGASKGHAWHFKAMAGAGALRSTAEDMIQYGKSVMQPEITPLREAFALALQPHADFGAAGGQIGLGFMIRTVDGHVTYSHDGGTGGYRSMLRVIPELKKVQVVLINNNSLDGNAVVAATQPAKPKVVPAAQKEIPLAPEALQAFAGVYTVDEDTRFTVVLNQDHLWVRLTGQPFLRVYPKSPNRVFYKAVAAEIEFSRAGDEVTALTLFQHGNELNATREKQPAPNIILHCPEELKPYGGTYSILGLTDLIITIRGSTLYAQLGEQPALPVFETAPDRFDYDVVEASLVFTRDDKRNINGVTLLQNGMQLPGPRKQKPAR